MTAPEFPRDERRDEEHFPEWMRVALQRLRDEMEARRGEMLARALGDPPRPGYYRDVRTGRERPATVAELRECDRLLAKHRDPAGPQTQEPPAA